MERMSRMSLVAFVALLLPAVAAAQTPVAPPAPPAPAAAPQAPPTPMAPPVGPAPMAVFVPPVVIDSDSIQSAVEAARIDSQAIREQAAAAREEAQAAREQALEAAQQARFSTGMMAPMAFRYDQDYGFKSTSTADSNYNAGLSALTQHQYENAITRFDRVIAAKSSHADGALYYKAWALSKLGRSDDAVAALGQLRKDYSSSPYLNEARTLEANVKKLGPDQVSDDDLKLLAIQALQYSDPEKAVSTCEAVLSGPNSLQVKRRAIYTLALIDRPEAHEVLLSYAKGKGNPELQRDAINYLGARGSKQPTKSSELIDIYNSTSDVDVKMAVISAFRAAGDKAALVAIASGQGIGVGGAGGGVGVGRAAMVMSPEQINLRSRAISNLSDVASPQELWPLYEKEENKDLRSEWVSTFSSMGAIDQLVQIVKTEKEPTVRQRAIRALGNQKADKTGTMLVNLYGSGDKDTKEAVISALGNQNNAEDLITIAKKETDKDLKYKCARQLLDMAPRSKAAADYLADIIK